MEVRTHVALFPVNSVWIAPNNLFGLPAGYVWGESGTAGTSTHGTRSGAGSGAGGFGGEPAWAGILPGSVVTVTVPQGNTGNPTTLAAAGATTIQANPGLAPVTTTGGLGGTASGNTIARAGGAGANAISGSSVNGGAGGGSAGSTGAGGAAVTSTGGAAGTGAAGPPSLAGVAGSNGPGALAPGVDGVVPGGGASGGGSGGTINHAGGNGAAGQALMIWQTLELSLYSRGVPNAHRGSSSSSRGAPVTGGASTPSVFVPPSSSSRGRAGRPGRIGGSSRGAPVIPPAAHPSPFALPARSSRGQLARRGSSSSSRGAPVRTSPSPFALPPRPSAGRPGRRGRVLGPGLFSAGSPVVPPPVIPTLLVALAAAAGTDDYGNAYPQGIFASEGVIQGPTIIGSDAFYYDPSPGFGNLTQSVTSASGSDQYGNAYIAGTATYNNAGSFWSAVVVSGGTVDWYKASGAGGPWTFEAEIGFDWNNLTGGGLVLNAPAGLSGTVGGIPFQIPVNTPAASASAIINALQLAGIFF
jgi:hypothetical protein